MHMLVERTLHTAVVRAIMCVLCLYCHVGTTPMSCGAGTLKEHKRNTLSTCLRSLFRGSSTVPLFLSSSGNARTLENTCDLADTYCSLAFFALFPHPHLLGVLEHKRNTPIHLNTHVFLMCSSNPGTFLFLRHLEALRGGLVHPFAPRIPTMEEEAGTGKVTPSAGRLRGRV